MPVDKDQPPRKPDFQKSPDSFESYVVHKLDHLENAIDRLENTVNRLDNTINGINGQDGILTRLRVVEKTMATKMWVLVGALVGFVNFAGLVVALIKVW